jgi:hypothetical protein
MEPLFRDFIDVEAADDDILEVGQNAKLLVQSLVDALKYDSWMEAEDFRKAMTGVRNPFTASEK